MNKNLFETLVQTEKNLNGKIDKESQRYLDKTIKERKLDGWIKIWKKSLFNKFLKHFKSLRNAFKWWNKRKSKRAERKNSN